ncbi:hypothetical protein IGP50_12325 [Escherichia coli]|uniref:hypothetical protein n=1 Tax=Escherichia coli TaxID=562 RepID=UPI00226F8B14|nr:hypothetical protein [Escherichia coli]MCX9322020.1 hypothetical protein [Escherichia coli]
MGYDYKEHISNAKRLYEIGDNASLRYCALELRFAIECHVYIQLRAGLGTIPETVINTWQPPQAIKSLCMFEETADQDLKVTITCDDSNEITANYKNIKYKDLNKWYNTLGSFLHQPTIKKQEFQVDKNKLNSILSNLAELCDHQLITFHRDYEKIKCEKCKKEIIFTENYVKKNNKIDCQNAGCHNYVIIRLAPDGTYESFQSAVVACFICGEKNHILLCDMEDGAELYCKTCKNKHVIKKAIFSQDKVAPIPEFTFENSLLVEDKE